MKTIHVPLPLDHIGWLVEDLGAHCGALGQLGFAVTEPGTLQTGAANEKTEDVGQQSAHVMFTTTYLELTAVAPGARPAHLAPYMGRGGLIILALRVADAAASAAATARAGLNPAPAAYSDRPLTYPPPADQGVAKFHWFMFGASDFPEVLVCCVEHLTPQLVFQETVASHANGAQGLAEVLVVHPDVETARERFERLGTALAASGGSRGGVTLLDPAAAQGRFPGLKVDVAGGPLGVVLHVGDLAALAERLAAVHGDVIRDADRLWCPGPAGSVLEFRQRQDLPG